MTEVNLARLALELERHLEACGTLVADVEHVANVER